MVSPETIGFFICKSLVYGDELIKARLILLDFLAFLR